MTNHLVGMLDEMKQRFGLEDQPELESELLLLLGRAYEAGRLLGAEEERVKCSAWVERRTFTVKL